MTDEQLLDMSAEVDIFIASLSHKYEINPLSLAAVLIARMMVFNKQAGSKDDFLSLLNGIVQDPPMTKYDSKVH